MPPEEGMEWSYEEVEREKVEEMDDENLGNEEDEVD